MNFKSLVEEQLLIEMPYIDMDQQLYDLEAEKYVDAPEILFKKIQNILAGYKLHDKYGRKIHLTTKGEKTIFRKKIRNSPIIKKIVPGHLLKSL